MEPLDINPLDIDPVTVHKATIDLATFAELRDAVGDDFAIELVDTFCEEAPGILAELRIALVAADADGYRRAAHSLKANGHTFGALTFAALARDAEHRGIYGDTDVDTAVVDRLEVAYTAAATELRVIARG